MLPYSDAYMDEAREHYKTRIKYHESSHLLKELMAVINGDGGHRADSFGSIHEAVEDCIRIFHVKTRIAEDQSKVVVE